MEVEALIHSRQQVLVNYSPYSFIREIKPSEQFDFFVKEKMNLFGSSELHHQLAISVDGMDFIFLYEYLPWDSNYFKRSCYKLFTVLYDQQNAPALINAIHIFKDKVQQNKSVYCFAEIPTEDIFLIQCLNEAGVRLIETRLHYYRNKLENFIGERYSVREATSADIPVLKQVASANRNNYDRLHADYFYEEKEADDYLATYAEAAVNGFCDHVFVPDVKNLPVESFIAFDFYKSIISNKKLSLMYGRLGAVGPANKGWYVKLLSEFLTYAKKHQVSYIKITTQSTNKSVIKTFEKLGFHLGATSHVLAFSSL